MKEVGQVLEWLTVPHLNTNVVNAAFAVRGDIVRRAQVLAKEVESNNGTFEFNRIVWCNIGNPQLLGQKPLTYVRQVLCLMEYPELLSAPLVGQWFPSDVRDKAKELLSEIPGGLGAYSESAGVTKLRERIARSIARRDGYACTPDNIYLTDGATPGVHYLMQILLADPGDGFMVPIPQYPLYSAALSLYGGQLVPYLLEESHGWALNLEHLESQMDEAKARGLHVRALVVINPGNPTGQCLCVENMQDIVRFCLEHKVVLIADEVYQRNVYDESKVFTSFKKVACQMGVVEQLPLVSLHSASKGYLGECGRRGGFLELSGFPTDFHDQVLKLASINVCPNVSGQVCCVLGMEPPQVGQPSYPRYCQERDAILGSLKRRAKAVEEALNQLEGVSCTPAEGAMYVFPRITLPRKACEAAARQGKPGDWLYCKELLESTGVVVVPGSGFSQQEGTFHFRTTFLPPESEIKEVVERLSAFHQHFLKKYGGLAVDSEVDAVPLGGPLQVSSVPATSSDGVTMSPAAHVAAGKPTVVADPLDATKAKGNWRPDQTGYRSTPGRQGETCRDQAARGKLAEVEVFDKHEQGVQISLEVYADALDWCI